ncbi:MAG: 3-methyladenine DNA glycosylase [Arthrobacter sp.]|uniref:DNA-3-methyladenine glycosylase family protein n=1 Tax=Arthrobacter sp. TaxID=1667 RepID=UPI0034918CF4
MTVPPTPARSGPPARADAEAEWDVEGHYALGSTLSVLQRGAHDPCARVGDSLAWLCFGTEDGPASLRLSAVPRPAAAPGCPATTVRIQGWGPGARLAVASAPALLGERDDWSAFDEPGFAETLPRMASEARRAHPGVRLPSTGRVFDSLVPAILEQKVTTIEARHAWRYLARKFGSPAPGPAPEGMRIPPGPHALRRIGSWDWHAARVDLSRRTTILRAAESAAGIDRLGALRLEEDPGRRLQGIPGIGPWTTAEVLQRTHGHPDSVSVGDYHLAAYVGYALTGRKTDDAGMLDLLRPWSGHRQRVVRMIGLSGFRKPAFGPRLAPEDHRGR